MRQDRIIIFLWLLFVLTNFHSNLQAQQKDTDSLPRLLSLTPEKKIAGQFTRFNIDPSGNVYAITKNGKLIKFNPNGDSVAAFNDVKRFGTPQQIDARNPFKIRLFYQASGYIVTLDQLLTFRSQINLRSLGLTNVSTIAQSYDDNIWVFDSREFKLKKINESGTIINEGDDLRLLTETAPNPDYMTETNDQVVFYDDELGFYLFNFYGRYINRLPFLHWKNPAVIGKLLIGKTNRTLRIYELQSLQENIFEVSRELDNQSLVKWGKESVYVLNQSGIQIFKTGNN